MMRPCREQLQVEERLVGTIVDLLPSLSRSSQVSILLRLEDVMQEADEQALQDALGVNLSGEPV